MLAQLNFNEYFIDEFSLAVNRTFESGEARTGTIDVDFDIKRSGDNPLDFMVTLLVYLNKSDEAFHRADYRIFLKLTGYFSFNEGVTEEAINGMIAPNGLSMLYGVARGIVSNTTATSWHGKLMLPAINFVELIQQKVMTEKKTPAKKVKMSKKTSG